MNSLLVLCVCLVAAVYVQAEIFDSFVQEATCGTETFMEETTVASCYWDE
ncbi:hypothetical protein KIPB_015158, partial [Kipferlia bialata]|eukprot:g15158.t1